MGSSARDQPQTGPDSTRSTRRTALLDRAFALFNSLRLVAYLPTLWSLAASADSSQHSAITWAIWTGANLSTGLWLWDRTGSGRGLVAVSLANALMCACATGLIVWLRA